MSSWSEVSSVKSASASLSSSPAASAKAPREEEEDSGDDDAGGQERRPATWLSASSHSASVSPSRGNSSLARSAGTLCRKGEETSRREAAETIFDSGESRSFLTRFVSFASNFTPTRSVEKREKQAGSRPASLLQTTPKEESATEGETPFRAPRRGEGESTRETLRRRRDCPVRSAVSSFFRLKAEEETSGSRGGSADSEGSWCWRSAAEGSWGRKWFKAAAPPSSKNARSGSKGLSEDRWIEASVDAQVCSPPLERRGLHLSFLKKRVAVEIEAAADDAEGGQGVSSTAKENRSPSSEEGSMLAEESLGLKRGVSCQVDEKTSGGSETTAFTGEPGNALHVGQTLSLTHVKRAFPSWQRRNAYEGRGEAGCVRAGV